MLKRFMYGAGSALVFALSLKGQTPALPAQFGFTYAPGETFRYVMVGGHTMSGGNIERGTTQFDVTIGNRIAGGWTATERVTADGQSNNYAIKIAETGVWTDSEGSVILNFITLDPRTVCVAKSTVAAGDTWSCDVLGNHTRTPGTEAVNVLSASSNSIVLDVTGEGPVTHTMRSGEGGAAPLAVVERSWWHDVLTFVRGQSTKIEHSIKHTTQFGPGGPTRTTTGSSILEAH